MLWLRPEHRTTTGEQLLCLGPRTAPVSEFNETEQDRLIAEAKVLAEDGELDAHDQAQIQTSVDKISVTHGYTPDEGWTPVGVFCVLLIVLGLACGTLSAYLAARTG